MCSIVPTQLSSLPLLTWQVAPCLSHHPYWYTLDRFPASCSQYQVVLQLRKNLQGHLIRVFELHVADYTKGTPTWH